MEELFEDTSVNPSTVLNKTDQNVLVIDKAGKILFANDEAEENMGKKGEDLLGDYFQSNIDYPNEGRDDSSKNSTFHWPINKEKDSDFTEGIFWESNGDRIPVDFTTKPLKNDQEEIIGAIVSLKDKSMTTRLKEELKEHRNHDRLTGLPNHFKFRGELENYLNQDCCTRQGAVLLLDIDRFKEVNNSFGFGAADDLLTSVAELLRDKLSKSDTLARFSGDEFVVFSPERNRGDVEELARKLTQAVRDHDFRTKGRNIQATISIGYALFPDQGDSTDDLLAKADIALSRAKQSGRNQFKIFNPNRDSRKEVKSRVGWVNRIDKAIKKNNFVLYAQPILELGSDNISHYEVLIRMLEGGGELISPGKFLPIAEKFGLSRDIDKWVINKALESLPGAAANGLNHQFAINLSGQSLTDNELLDWLKCNQTLEEGNFGNILFEVTETAALSNIKSANSFISTLKSRGSQFALDDFGMGFSSFNYLKQLSVDYLKIDGSFIQNLPRDSMNQDLVQSIVEVAHRLKKETIAEFVEDEETLQMVRNYGTDHAQGYHIGRPQPLQSLL
ncbi:EAL domain-containing protein [Candidatus Bipolaricaulota bacterium]|nr:EAL domain-containing protein [Candidatus Bipolaricaulota bacterium]